MTAVSAPGTPADRIFAGWLDSFNSGEVTQIREFHALYDPDLDPSAIEMLADFRVESGGLTLIRFEKHEPLALVALLAERDGEMIEQLDLTVTADDPPKINTIIVRPVPRPPDLALQRLSEAEALEALDARLDALTAADRFSGIMVIERNGHVVFERCAGLADRDANTPVTPDTRFRHGSISKMFTAVATLQLVERGTLALTDAVGHHLTDYPNRNVADHVTIAHLLTHTGGIGDVFGPEFTANRLMLREHADYVTLYGSRELTHMPGAEFRYSNYGYVLLGAILEHVTGMSYYDVVRQQIFDPAGMTSTDSLPESEVVPGRAVGYMRRHNAWVANTEWLPWRGTAAGLGYSTARDLLRFAHALEAGALLSRTMLAEATRPHIEHYGYGFGTRGDGDARRYGHSGGAPGMNADLRVYPALGSVVVALANLDPLAASRPVEFFTLRMPMTLSSA